MGSLPYGKSLLPRPLALLAGIAVILLAAAAGWWAADQLAREPIAVVQQPTLKVRTSTADLTLRAGWKLDPKVPKVPGLEGADARALAPVDGGRGRMIVALLKDQPADIPAATVKALRVPLGASERATVGGLRGIGYTALSLQGVNGLADLYTLRTTGGLLTIACIAPIDDPLPAGSCPSDVTHVSVTVPPAPDPAANLKAALPALTTTLNKARMDGRLALRATGDSDAQRDAAHTLQRAYATAASSAATVAPKTGKGADVPADFRAAASAYGTLAKAANRHDRHAWAKARKAVDAAEAKAAAAIAVLGA